METVPQPPQSNTTVSWFDPRSTYWTTDYLKKLLMERHGIRASLENPGGSVILASAAQAADTDQGQRYSPVIGNDFHLDLLEAEQEVNRLELQDRIELLSWCDGMTAKQAANYASIKGGKVRSTKPSAMSERHHHQLEVVVAGVQ